MISIDRDTCQNITSLLNQLDIIIPQELKAIVEQLKNQLSVGQCDEIVLCMVLTYLKSIQDKELEELVKESLDKKEEATDQQQKEKKRKRLDFALNNLIFLLTELSIEQTGGFYNEIRRDIW